METLLITGANRGLGLEHTRQALAAGDAVIAACRTPADADQLHALVERYPDALRIEQLDTTDAGSVADCAARLADVPVDLLMNNAGMAGGLFEKVNEQTLGNMNYETWRAILEVNVLGVFRATAAFMPNLKLGTRRIVMMISSDLGSIGNNTMGLMHAYRSSKAALNMLTKGLAIELRDEGMTVFAMAPGWVKTDLGGENAHWEPEESIRRQRAVMAGITADNSGQFINLKGEPVAW